MTNNQTIALSAVAATTVIGFAALFNVGSGIDLTAFSVTPNTTGDTSAQGIWGGTNLAAWMRAGYVKIP